MVATRLETPATRGPGDRAVPIPVLILNWNGLADTIECVDALLKSENADFHVVLVDNGSEGDDFGRLAERYADDARIEVRSNEENLGFARGMNLLLQEILDMTEDRPEYVALLNNDAVPETDWLAALVEAAAKTGAGSVASRMIRHDDPDRLDNAGHVFLNTGEVLPRGTNRPPAEYDQPAEVAGACAGACLYRTDMLADIGLFDGFFDTGYEDAELGLRAMLAGYRQVYAPEAIVRHRIGASIDKIRDRRYAVRLQVNINYTYLKLMPAAVMAWNAPWIALKSVAMLVVPLLTLRWRLLGVQAVALVQTLGVVETAFRARRRMAKRRLPVREIIRRQEFFARRYREYFRRFVLGRRPTVFER
ncbi:MAG: glycosyltransferase family 2 protein [Wenzhouxiangellaceae bacterium]|nr:glycosyltransferase family 2 protein [Wenzhouxiangellaceae bacterium]